MCPRLNGLESLESKKILKFTEVVGLAQLDENDVCPIFVMVFQNLMIQLDRRILEALGLVHLAFLKTKDINIDADWSHEEVESVSI